MYVIYIYYHMRAAAGAEAPSATPRYMVDGDDMVHEFERCILCTLYVKETDITVHTYT